MDGKETSAEVQVRILHERRCAEVFEEVRSVFFPQRNFTLVTMGSDSSSEFSSVDFKTTLPLPDIADAAEELVSSWYRGPRLIRSPINGNTMREAIAHIERSLPLDRSFACIVGEAGSVSYFSRANREDMKTLLRNPIVRWRAEVHPAPSYGET